MLRYVHTLSAILFYVLGASFFVAYVLGHNQIWPETMFGWLSIGDLPLLFIGLLYGGLSIYRSIQQDSSPSRGLMIAIGLPLLILFLVLITLNFWQ